VVRNPLVRLPKPLIRFYSGLHTGWAKATRGRVISKFRGAPVVLLTTSGRKSGKDRTRPLLTIKQNNAYAFAASNGGHDQHPGWYLNLLANPEVTVTDRGRKIRGRARIATEPERSDLYQRFVDVLASYGDYAKATEREIPVVVVEPS
jgi:F420H(2)-dependent quinone reductase